MKIRLKSRKIYAKSKVDFPNQNDLRFIFSGKERKETQFKITNQEKTNEKMLAMFLTNLTSLYKIGRN